MEEKTESATPDNGVKISFGRQELESYSFLYDAIEDRTLRLRAYSSLAYYINKAAFYKFAWSVLSFLGIILPAAATYFTCKAEVNAKLIAFITALTTVASGTLALFKCADKKGAYRNSAENLKSELSEYCAKTGRYSSVEDSERNAIFSEAMERIIKQGYRHVRGAGSAGERSHLRTNAVELSVPNSTGKIFYMQGSIRLPVDQGSFGSTRRRGNGYSLYF